MNPTLSREEALALLEKRLGHYRVARDFHNFCCPFCGDRKYRFGVNLTTRNCYCFRCEVKGSVRKVLGLHIKAGKALPGRRLQRILAPSTDPVGRPWKDLPDITMPNAKVSSLAEEAFAYLEERCVDRITAHMLGLGYGIKGKWLHRVIHPHYHDNGVLAGWQGRSVTEGGAKLLTSTEDDIPSNRTAEMGAVIGLEMVRRGEGVVICEGPYDALSVSRVMPGVSILGSALQPAQVRRLLKRGVSEFIIGFDPDKQKSALKAAKVIRRNSRTPIKIVRWGGLTDVDFGDLTSGAVHSVLTEMVEPWSLGTTH